MATKGFQKVELESVQRLRRNNLLVRSVKPTADDRRELERALAAALLLALLVGAAACREWVLNEARRAARKTGEKVAGSTPRFPSNVQVALERLAEDPMTARVSVAAESASIVMATEVAAQIERRGALYIDGFNERTIEDAVRLVGQGHHTSPDPLVSSMMSRARNHARVAELAAKQSLYIAFNDAVAEVAETPEGLLRFPLWEIRETIDEVTRGNPMGKYPEPHRHFQFSGYVNTMDEIVRQRCVPPNGFNCRAELVPWGFAKCVEEGLLLPSGQPDVVAIGVRNGHRQDLIDSGQYPDKGYSRS